MPEQQHTSCLKVSQSFGKGKSRNTSTRGGSPTCVSSARRTVPIKLGKAPERSPWSGTWGITAGVGVVCFGYCSFSTSLSWIAVWPDQDSYCCCWLLSGSHLSKGCLCCVCVCGRSITTACLTVYVGEGGGGRVIIEIQSIEIDT